MNHDFLLYVCTLSIDYSFPFIPERTRRFEFFSSHRPVLTSSPRLFVLAHRGRLVGVRDDDNDDDDPAVLRLTCYDPRACRTIRDLAARVGAGFQTAAIVGGRMLLLQVRTVRILSRRDSRIDLDPLRLLRVSLFTARASCTSSTCWVPPAPRGWWRTFTTAARSTRSCSP